jgi:tetratricopeptide (TPR) repeat protein
MTDDEVTEKLCELGRLVALKPREAVRGARQLYRVLRKADPREVHPEVLHESGQALANIFLNAGRPKWAIRVARWAMKVDWDCKQEGYHRFLLGSCYLELGGRDKAAVEEFDKAVRLVEREDLQPRVYYNAAGAYGKIGDYARAVEYFRKVLEVLPSPLLYKDRRLVQIARTEMADFCALMGRYDEATQILEDTLRMGDLLPGVRAMVYASLGNIHDDLGEYRAAAEHYREAVQSCEEDIDRRRNSGPPEYRDSEISELAELKEVLSSCLHRCERGM